MRNVYSRLVKLGGAARRDTPSDVASLLKLDGEALGNVLSEVLNFASAESWTLSLFACLGP